MKIFKFFAFFVSLSFAVLFNYELALAEETNISSYEIIGDQLKEFPDHEHLDGYYTNVTTLSIKLTISEADRNNLNYSGIKVCSTDKNTVKSHCETYALESGTINYQIPFGDGEKDLNVSFARIDAGEVSIGDTTNFVLDTVGPKLVINSERNITIERNSKYEIPVCVATDEVFNINYECVVSGADFSTSTYGTTHEVTFTSIDELGNISTYTQMVVIEDKPKFEINAKVVIAVFLGLVLIGAYIYIRVWKKKEKERERERLLQEGRSNLKNKLL